MKILVDGHYTPGIVSEICKNAAQKAGLQFEIIRSREKDLYQKQSKDYEEEVRNSNRYQVFQPMLEIMQPGDLLVTSDNELAAQAINRVTAVIHPDGYLYTTEGINLTTIDEYLARIYGRHEGQAHPLKSRDPELNELFKQVLYQFIGNVG